MAPSLKRKGIIQMHAQVPMPHSLERGVHGPVLGGQLSPRRARTRPSVWACLVQFFRVDGADIVRVSIPIFVVSGHFNNDSLQS